VAVVQGQGRLNSLRFRNPTGGDPARGTRCPSRSAGRGALRPLPPGGWGAAARVTAQPLCPRRKARRCWTRWRASRTPRTCCSSLFPSVLPTRRWRTTSKWQRSPGEGLGGSLRPAHRNFFFRKVQSQAHSRHPKEGERYSTEALESFSALSLLKPACFYRLFKSALSFHSRKDRLA